MKRTKKLTYSALFTALGVVLLLLASVLEIADIAVSMFASAILVLSLIELGQSFSVMIYAATSLLSLLFLPNKFIAAVYLVFSGLYPLIKRFFDKRGKILAWILKFLYFNFALTAALLLARFLFSVVLYEAWMLALYFVIANTAFVLFDIVIGRMSTLYLVRYRHRLRRFFK